MIDGLKTWMSFMLPSWWDSGPWKEGSVGLKRWKIQIHWHSLSFISIPFKLYFLRESSKEEEKNLNLQAITLLYARQCYERIIQTRCRKYVNFKWSQFRFIFYMCWKLGRFLKMKKVLFGLLLKFVLDTIKDVFPSWKKIVSSREFCHIFFSSPV